MGFGMYFFLKNLYNFNIIGLYQRDLKMNFQSFFWKVRKQSGFTLLELLVVIAVIGILASLAVPRFQNQLKKAKFVEVVNATSPYKTAIELCAQRGNALSACDATYKGMTPDSGESTSKVVKSVTVGANGVITATGGDAVDGKDYILTPTTVNNGLSWAVSGGCIDASLCEPNK